MLSFYVLDFTRIETVDRVLLIDYGSFDYDCFLEL